MKECFNKAAEQYDSNCQLQLYVGEKLISLIGKAEIVIDLGCGTGIVTEKLQYKKLYALDIADKLLAKAKLRLGELNVTYLEEDFDQLANLQVDLAFANMSLQWSSNLKLALHIIKAILKPTATLAFSLPLLGTFADLQASTQDFYSFKQVKDMLKDWQIIHSSEEKINYIFPSLIDSLKSIRSVGAHYCKFRKNKIIPRDKIPHSLVYNIGYFVIKL